MSTLALGTEAAAGSGSEAGVAASGARPTSAALRYADLAVLALALPVFLVAGWPLLGYAAAAAAWLAQHAILAWADHAAVAALKRGERNRALGIVGFSTLGRLWLVTTTILLAGLLGEREDGLAAALLTLVLVTVHLGCLAYAKLFGPEASR